MEEGNICCRGTAGFEDGEYCLVAYGIKSFFDIEVQDDRQTFLLSSLMVKYAVNFCLLTRGASSWAEGLLSIVDNATVLNCMVQPDV